MKDYERERKLASDITDALNTFSFNGAEFCTAMSREHRYLQGEFFELVCKFIRYAGSDHYGYDGRNEFVHRISKEICEKMDWTI